MSDPKQPLPAPQVLDDYLAIFERHGETDREYLMRHHRRFLDTFYLFSANWSPDRGCRILDIGAHWLHQSVLYARAGYEVTAADLATTLKHPGIRSVAVEHGIRLVAHGNLDGPGVFSELDDGRFDVVLFCEVLEHMAFNPLHFWTEVHRLMVPGGRIVLTTPNYYFWKSRIRGVLRLLTATGAGVGVRDVLGRHTYAHHWKEYSARELKQYFSLLSPDFRVARILGRPYPGPLARTLYAEIDLVGRSAGIRDRRSW